MTRSTLILILLLSILPGFLLAAPSSAAPADARLVVFEGFLRST